jgi:hypothetical protein
MNDEEVWYVLAAIVMLTALSAVVVANMVLW